jgi:hypothetical protein
MALTSGSPNLLSASNLPGDALPIFRTPTEVPRRTIKKYENKKVAYLFHRPWWLTGVTVLA